MQLKEVKSSYDFNRFISFPVSLYKNEKYWIRPLNSDIRDVFDPHSNNMFKTGDCICWVAEVENRIYGRIAAFANREVDKDGNESMHGGVGFFECVDDQKIADALFNASKEWLLKRGCTFMDGPINFGNRDKWWGLLTKGFDIEPNYRFNYNLPYYQKLFEQYGFKTYYEHYTFIRILDQPVDEHLIEKARKNQALGDYTVRQLDQSYMEKMTEDIVKIYNKAWVNHEEVAHLTREQGHKIMKRLKPILDTDLIYVAYYKEDPVGMYFNIPDVNQFLKHLNGKIDWWGKIKFAWYRLTKKNRKILGFLFGIVPEHQGKGVDGIMIEAMYETTQRLKSKYKTIEISGIGDFNKKMITVVKQVGGDVGKVHTTYRYLFDRSVEFERMKPIN